MKVRTRTIEPITVNSMAARWSLYLRNVAEYGQLPVEWFRCNVLGDPACDPEMCLVAMASRKLGACGRYYKDEVAR